MGTFEPEFLAGACGGRWVVGEPTNGVSGFSYDTRSLSPGDMFIAIETPIRDGHDFLADAKAKGAVAALVEKPQESIDLPQLQVASSLEAFRDIARAFRRTWTFPVIAVTGSCGKTSVKDLLTQLLGGANCVHATQGNLNNSIGVPATMLGADGEGCRFAVIEAGISELGEMATLAKAIEPDIAVFTAIGPAHLDGLENIDTIAREKALLASGEMTKDAYLGSTWAPYSEKVLGGGGCLLVEDDSMPLPWSYRSLQEDGGSRIEIRGAEGIEAYRIPAVGRGNISNAALAIAVARSCGISVHEISHQLRNWKPSGMRGEWRSAGQANVFVDCYNANPLSMSDALDVFRSTSTSPRFYVVGSMGELGDQAESLHEKIGGEIILAAGDRVGLVGDWARSYYEGMRDAGQNMDQVAIFETVDGLETELKAFKGDVFLKGSRRYRLETALDYLSASTQEQEAAC